MLLFLKAEPGARNVAARIINLDERVVSMEIKILGTGCANCQKLEKMTKEVVRELGIEATVDKVTDLKEIARAGVLMTPGLVIDGEVKASGKVPSKAEITQIITSALAK